MNCKFDADTLRCVRCGYLARRLPTHRICHSHGKDFARRGPGTELARLLKRFGIQPTPTCACRAKAAEMDRWGADECSKPHRIEEIVAVMRREAQARGLPFLDAAGRLLVRRAIRNARRAAS